MTSRRNGQHVFGLFLQTEVQVKIILCINQLAAYAVNKA